MEGGKGNSGGNNGKGRPGTVIIPRRSLPGEQQGVISGNTPKNSVAPTDVSGVAGASMVSSSTLQEGTSTTVEQPKLTGSRRKRTSDVWENFKTELINGKWQAICNWCHKPYAGESTSVICEELHACLVKWHLEKKISTVALDNCASNDKAIEIMPNKLDTSSLMMDGSLLHMHCAAHILNQIVKDGLDVMEKGTKRVQDSVAFLSATPKRHEKFEKMARLFNNEYKCRLALDCKTRWNSTYIMLKGALQYKDVLERLYIREKNFTCPTEEDWVFAMEVCDRLKVFFDVKELLSGTPYVTASLFFPQICGIRLAIRKWE
uniref:BED-type domain-containing protein n=1 Tax=Aegilops tauschii subsp. strangulata TaxID=200361 RepID=A0A453NUH6_AEGTS